MTRIFFRESQKVWCFFMRAGGTYTRLDPQKYNVMELFLKVKSRLVLKSIANEWPNTYKWKELMKKRAFGFFL